MQTKTFTKFLLLIWMWTDNYKLTPRNFRWQSPHLGTLPGFPGYKYTSLPPGVLDLKYKEQQLFSKTKQTLTIVYIIKQISKALGPKTLTLIMNECAETERKKKEKTVQKISYKTQTCMKQIFI